jgi:hypothetical protein
MVALLSNVKLFVVRFSRLVEGLCERDIFIQVICVNKATNFGNVAWLGKVNCN